MKRNTPNTTPTPDKAGSRATSIAHFSTLILAWRKRRSLSRAEAACLLCCTERTIKSWERERSMPRGFTLRAIIAAIEGGAL